jgi:CRISPR-associated protein Cas1
MNYIAVRSENDEAHNWSIRSQFWLHEYEKSQPIRKKRKQASSPLVLAGHGLSIRLDKGALVIRDGNTHYPAKIREWRFFKGALDRPPRIVVVDGSGAITLDALDWMSEQSIPLIRLRWDGRLLTAIHGSGYAANPDKAAWQMTARADETERVKFALPLIQEKIRGTLTNLESYLSASRAQELAIRVATEALDQFAASPPKSMRDLLGIEGKSAAAYFRSWNALALKWVGLNQNPVPQNWMGYSSRSALTAKKTARNIRATHPINAMLNYAYGILEAQTRIQVVAEGYDPTRGIGHGDKQDDRHTFVFDRMEPGRPIAERRILKFVRDHKFSATDFTITSKGTCRLNPELARLVTGSVSSGE